MVDAVQGTKRYAKKMLEQKGYKLKQKMEKLKHHPIVRELLKKQTAARKRAESELKREASAKKRAEYERDVEIPKKNVATQNANGVANKVKTSENGAEVATLKQKRHTSVFAAWRRSSTLQRYPLRR
eukprot:TRINITY_DN20122_c0_g1_i1.p2 TRINITY_DN20122_c0_g1~~TRINITY_DN20122_c0_g1_i1.p2  ORF type:complete len:143 (+),score=25.14 TRINITY_DN20122_c0_g1_i1:51-431(+)